MYHYLVGISIFKSFTPYFRKHICKTLNGEEFLYANTMLISMFVFMYFLYKLLSDKKRKLMDVIKNYQNLSSTQLLAILFISTVAVSSTIFIFEFDKHFNTPLLNSIYLETLTTVSLILVAIFIFEEKYTWTQIFGIFMVAAGIYLITQKQS